MDGKITLTLPQQLSGEEGGPGREKQKAKKKKKIPRSSLVFKGLRSPRGQGEI